MICHNEDCETEAVKGKSHCAEHACAYAGCAQPHEPLSTYCSYHDGYVKAMDAHKTRIQSLMTTHGANGGALRNPRTLKPEMPSADKPKPAKQPKTPSVKPATAERAKKEPLPPLPPEHMCRVPRCLQQAADLDLCRGCHSSFLVWRRFKLAGLPSDITPSAEQLLVFESLHHDLQRRTGT